MADDDQKAFKKKVRELLERAVHMQELRKQGYVYRRVRVKSTTVKTHTRGAHFARRMVRP